MSNNFTDLRYLNTVLCAILLIFSYQFIFTILELGTVLKRWRNYVEDKRWVIYTENISYKYPKYILEKQASKQCIYDVNFLK